MTDQQNNLVLPNGANNAINNALAQAQIQE